MSTSDPCHFNLFSSKNNHWTGFPVPRPHVNRETTRDIPAFTFLTRDQQSVTNFIFWKPSNLQLSSNCLPGYFGIGKHGLRHERRFPTTGFWLVLNDLFLPFAWLAQYGHVLVGWYYIHARSYTGTIVLALRIINFFTLFKDETYNYIVRIIFFFTSE